MDLMASKHFPLASKYNPDWLLAAVSGAANPLWLTEWLCESLELEPGMRVLDLGCGLAASSIFLRREFGVQVWATDLWFSQSDNTQRIKDAGIDGGVVAVHADARALPFEASFFDAIVSIDSFYYYGTDDLYLSYIARFLKPGGAIAHAGAGLMREIEGPLPEHLRAWWTPDLWCLHSAGWWRRHWERTGLVDVEVADAMPEGWRRWLEWHHVVAPNNAVEINAIQEDQGRYVGYVRVIGRRRADVQLDEPVLSVPTQYVKKPLLR